MWFCMEGQKIKKDIGRFNICKRTEDKAENKAEKYPTHGRNKRGESPVICGAYYHIGERY